MNICILSQEYPYEGKTIGGIGTYSYYLAKGLSKHNHNVFVISKDIGKELQEEREERIYIKRAGPIKLSNFSLYKIYLKFSKNVHNFKKEKHKLILTPWKIRKYLKGTVNRIEYSSSAYEILKRIINQHQIDVIETSEFYNESLSIFFRRMNIPIVIRLHTPLFLCNKLDEIEESLDSKIMDEMEKFCTLHANCLTAPSNAIKGIVSQRWKINSENIQVIPNPIDIDEYEYKETNTKSKNILFVGRLEVRKGIIILIESIPKVVNVCSDVKFLFVGHESQFKVGELLDKLEGYQKNVEFVGHKTNEELEKYYQNALICIVPSLWENFPYVMLEAMAYGKCVIASDVGGLREIIEHEKDGILVPPGDSDTLSEKILMLIHNPDKIILLGKNAREKVKNKFSLDIIIPEMLKVYEKAIRKKI